MATLSNKHANVQKIFYPGFDGGLNLSVPSESMAKNELKEALNVEFSSQTGSMKVRGGLLWSGRFNDFVRDVVPIQGRRGFLVRTDGAVKYHYFRWNNIWPVSGDTVYGTGKLSVVSWVDANGEDIWLITRGGHLYKFTESPVPKLTRITSSPIRSNLVFVRNGRVGVVDGSDTIRFSGVGDCENWTEDGADESSSKWLEVGYKDGMNIDAVVPLSKDLIIFKSPPDEPDKGTIWRLTGNYPDWQLLEVAHNTGTYSQSSVCVVGNDIYYATVSGIATLSSVTSYGEVKATWPDRKVSKALTPLLTKTAKVYDVPVKQQLWVSPSETSKEIWVLDYLRGIWTKFEYPQKIVYAVGVDNRSFLFIGRDLYEVNDDYTDDDYRDAAGNVQHKEIKARMKLGTVLSGMQTLVKGVFASFGIVPGCEAELLLGKYKMPFSIGWTADYIYDPPNDTQFASEDDDPLFPHGSVLTSRRECIVREWSIQPEIKISGGGCTVSTIGLEVVEV